MYSTHNYSPLLEYYHHMNIIISPIIACQVYSISNQSHQQKLITLRHQFHHLESMFIHVIFTHFT